jgi:hypothetical protein
MMRKVGTARSSSADGSTTAVRETITPMAAAPTVKGTDRPSMPSRGRTSARPSTIDMIRKMQSAAVRVETTAAASAASHTS